MIVDETAEGRPRKGKPRAIRYPARYLPNWVRLPSFWIENGGLHQVRWVKGYGSDQLAGLMTLTVIAHHCDQSTGVAQLTWDELCAMANLSRAKLSSGLGMLVDHGIIERNGNGRSSYRLKRYDPEKGWVQFPAKRMYVKEMVAPFSDFTLRLPAELNAMKLFFLFASRRDRDTNMALLTFDTIENYTSVSRNQIKRAISVLAGLGLIHIEHLRSEANPYGIAQGYRLAHLNPRQHMGTWGRSEDMFAFS